VRQAQNKTNLKALCSYSTLTGKAKTKNLQVCSRQRDSI
jgi:hypothetical protein